MYNICTMSEVLSRPDDNSEETFKEMVSEITPSWEKEDVIFVPEQCGSCPRILSMLGDLDNLGECARDLVKAAMGNKVIMSIDGETIDEDEAAGYLCKMAGEKLNELDEKTNIIKKEIRISTDGCKGPLVLGGSDGYRVVNVVTCGSPEVFEVGLGEMQIGEPVMIRRDLEEDED